jgi:putative Mg2+ transporter-C (MgtC) family protein
MPLHLSWQDYVLRLALAALAGAVIGINRTEHARPAGLRTTMLVCLAAAIAMLQANSILATGGRSPDSFVSMDILRFPLGILSGIGFIGAGVILRRGDLVTGVTTAATMWFVTVLGLCFGGGALALGIAGVTLGLVVLSLLPFVERRMRRDRSATLTVAASELADMDRQLNAAFGAAGFKIAKRSIAYQQQGRSASLEYELTWRAGPYDNSEPPFVLEFARRVDVQRLSWATHGPTVG